MCQENTCVPILDVWQRLLPQQLVFCPNTCCWHCQLPSPFGSRYKSLWATLDDFVWYWYEVHGNEVHKQWNSVAIELCLTCNGLAFALLGVNLDTCPLPHAPDALKILLEMLPSRIYGPPWYLKREYLLVPKPPFCEVSHVCKGSCHSGPIRLLPSSATSSDGPFSSLPSLNADAHSMLEPLPRVLLLQKPRHLLQHKAFRFSTWLLCLVQPWCMTMVREMCLTLILPPALPELDGLTEWQDGVHSSKGTSQPTGWHSSTSVCIPPLGRVLNGTSDGLLCLLHLRNVPCSSVH